MPTQFAARMQVEGSIVRVIFGIIRFYAGKREFIKRLALFSLSQPGQTVQFLLPSKLKPLHGIRVLDFSHALAGPYCTMMLADFGAEVYKLESPAGGDMGRGWGPPFAGEDSSFFLGLNRGKRGIAIDLKSAAGLDLCLRLIDKMDVLIENFRPGAMERLGLGFAALHARNRRLVYCSISGYGQAGPSRDEAAMDLIVECSSGFMSITGTEGGQQVRSGYAVADINAGMHSAIGILLALRARETSGTGQYVDVAMQDSLISAMSSNYMSYLGSQVVPRPLGASFGTVVPYTVFSAQDRAFSIAVGSEKLWATFCEAIARRDLIENPDFATNAQRVRNRRDLETLLAAVFQERPMSDWLQRLRAAGIPCSPVLNFQEVVQHPQSAEREMFPVIEHPLAGPQRITGTPIKLSQTPGSPGAAAPGLGEHTVEVLQEVLHLDRVELTRLMSDGVIARPKS
jgi:crotonobetainyl-CoA:carnitine CoA-transferase CaiB-like acyl-CoA transferase